ncbi:DUF3596 domain-containing protein [Acinetobacter sp. VNK23]|uniref:Arm DNA-binding domain-containing protein n=1 Tax=Acinetobacter thutiue TaxID=2998078 RepID=UPI002575FD29|nr:DUF3596 domain-containing protein [Acinetobacter thutiue]MDM1022105.1 DUF3596 domain-containing protein [Acinetobacter thutiue]
MSAGLEVRGNSMRIWIRHYTSESLIKETLGWPVTPANIQKAEKLADLIKLEIEMGTFDISRHFPESKHIKLNQMSYYAEVWKSLIEKDVSPNTFTIYSGQVDFHIIPYWGKTHPKDIDMKSIKKWIHKLRETLSGNTIREIVNRLGQIHSMWRNDNRISYNPFESIVIQQADGPEPDPFTKIEISKILQTKAIREMENMFPCLLWTGLSISEQIPIAWEDIDLENGKICIGRSYVRGVFRVTKNRRRKRQIKLLEPAWEALKKQYHFTGKKKPRSVMVLQRDNHTYKEEKLRFVWINPETSSNYEYPALRYRWDRHLKKANVRGRGINQGRHTFASQLLSSGQVPPEWIADQLGHTDTTMIYRHYGKLISEDMPDYLSRINNYIAQ